MNKTCKTCRHWEEEIIERAESRVGTCAIQVEDIYSMPSNGVGIICGHDGPIYFGCEFGCNMWATGVKE